MIPPGRRLSQVHDLIDNELFFVIHAPRQTGKTTLLRNLSRALTDEGRYAALTVSLETFTDPRPEISIPQFFGQIRAEARSLPVDLRPPGPGEFDGSPLIALQSFLCQWSATIHRPLVVFFDEIDALPPAVLISVLRQLRSGYTSRPAPFPQSVALVGLRDVRDYKVQIQQQTQTLGTSSPFNVKAESLVLRDFNEDEVKELLAQHTDETGQLFKPEAVAEIYHQTAGQPWLVNALAAQLTTRYDALVKNRSIAISRAKVFEAREILIERRDTHLDSLVDRLRDARVRRVIEPILVGEMTTDPTYGDDFSYTRDLGLVSIREGVRRIANPIYQEIIPRVLTHQIQTAIEGKPPWYKAADGTLDIRKRVFSFRAPRVQGRRAARSHRQRHSGDV